VGLKMSALSIFIVGVVCIVFGIMGIMEAGNAEQKVADELAPAGIALCDVHAAYGVASAALGTAMQSGDQETIQNATLQKTSLGLAKSNVSTIKFLRNTAILEIIAGAGLALAGVGLFKRD
jgi:divalent metal cation (Fe/Co/Zn/Cd) transporter